MFNLNRTENIKYTTYTGDGSGRDGYVVFGNGGLHGLRNYQGPNTSLQFKQNPCGSHARNSPIPQKEATAVDYIPDGNGRDSYIIRNYGLKANYQSKYKEFERGLRINGSPTPAMDQLQIARRDPLNKDATTYLNWPSKKAVIANRTLYPQQRDSVDRLSPSRSPRGISPVNMSTTFSEKFAKY